AGGDAAHRLDGQAGGDVVLGGHRLVHARAAAVGLPGGVLGHRHDEAVAGVALHAGQWRTVGGGRGKVGDGEGRPGGMDALAVVAQVEHDVAGAPGEVEGLLGVGGQHCLVPAAEVAAELVAVVGGLGELPVAYLHVVGRVHRRGVAHRRRRGEPHVVLGLADVVVVADPADAPHGAVELARAVPRPHG